MSEPIIQLKNVSKAFHSNGTPVEVLKDVDFSIREGESLAVIGASGIGKSTLLHIIGTLERPDSGALFFRGHDVLSFDDDMLANFRNKTMGFVFQFHLLLPEFNALENVMMPALIQGQSKKDAQEKAEAILVRVGLKDRFFHRVGALSGGEQQRVALARALVLQPVLLLADEPTGNLDKHNSEQVHQLLMELNRELRMTLIVVTHNMALADYMERQVTLTDHKLVDVA
jgi:lipoprotein-releasing system ATP-binding protein